MTVTYNAELDLGTITDREVHAEIQFQHGPVGENGFNGVQNEQVIELLIKRINALEDWRFPCDENLDAQGHLSLALEALNLRTTRRQAQGVEGQNVAHVS